MKSLIRREIILAAALICGGGCGKSGQTSGTKDSGNREDVLPVEVARLARGAIEATLRNSTHLEAEEEVKVFARTSNRVTELLVEEGDLVAKGQVLLRLDDDSQRIAVTRAQASYEKALREFERQKALFEEALISQQIFQDAEFERTQRELALADARRELEYTEVRAPIAGTVSQRLIKYGDLVNVNQHLFDIVDFDSIVARIYVPEKNLPEVKIDQSARVVATALGSEEFTGYVKRTAPVVESKTGTVKVTIAFHEVGRLRPGMYVDVELITSSRSNALLISKRAMLYDGELSFVYRLLPERKVERVLVQPRTADKFNVEPASGFNEGDEIVVSGQTGLKDGAKVRLPGDPFLGEKKAVQEQKAEQLPADKKS